MVIQLLTQNIVYEREYIGYARTNHDMGRRVLIRTKVCVSILPASFLFSFPLLLMYSSMHHWHVFCIVVVVWSCIIWQHHIWDRFWYRMSALPSYSTGGSLLVRFCWWLKPENPTSGNFPWLDTRVLLLHKLFYGIKNSICLFQCTVVPTSQSSVQILECCLLRPGCYCYHFRVSLFTSYLAFSLKWSTCIPQKLLVYVCIPLPFQTQ